jgi:hypothetical protein
MNPDVAIVAQSFEVFGAGPDAVAALEITSLFHLCCHFYVPID